MAISVTCPGCRKRLNVRDDWAGRSGTCPACGTQINIPANPTPPPPIRLERGHVEGAVSVNVHTPKRSSSLGIASLVTGVLGFLFCWVPLIGILSIPVSGIGLLLGLAGLIVAFVRRGSGVGYPIAGAVVSGLALCVAAFQVAMISAAANAVDQAAKKSARTNQTVVGPSDLTPDYDSPDEPQDQTADQQTTVKPDTAATGKTPSASSGAPATSEPEPNADSPEWASASDAVRQGDVQVRLTRIANKQVPLKSMINGETSSEDDLLSVYIEITNKSRTRKSILTLGMAK